MNQTEINCAVNDLTKLACRDGTDLATIIAGLQDAIADAPAVFAAARAADEEREGTS